MNILDLSSSPRLCVLIIPNCECLDEHSRQRPDLRGPDRHFPTQQKIDSHVSSCRRRLASQGTSVCGMRYPQRRTPISVYAWSTVLASGHSVILLPPVRTSSLTSANDGPYGESQAKEDNTDNQLHCLFRILVIMIVIAQKKAELSDQVSFRLHS